MPYCEEYKCFNELGRSYLTYLTLMNHSVRHDIGRYHKVALYCDSGKLEIYLLSTAGFTTICCVFTDAVHAWSKSATFPGFYYLHTDKT